MNLKRYWEVRCGVDSVVYGSYKRKVDAFKKADSLKQFFENGQESKSGQVEVWEILYQEEMIDGEIY